MTLRALHATKLSTAIMIGGVLVATSRSHGGHPLYTLVPTTPVVLHLDAGATANVSYTITNQTRIVQTIEMVPIHGVTQDVTGPGACAQPFVLQSKQSCTLTLTVAASGVSAHGIHGGPVICRWNTHYACAQPGTANQLSVVVNPPSHHP